MTVCVDTNALLQAMGRASPHRALPTAWMRGQFHWAISQAILLEYEELITRVFDAARWQTFLVFLDAGEQLHGQLMRTEPSFHFRLIAADPDDDKFADCAITAVADYVITNDRHFDVLASAGFKVRAITLEEFIRRHLAGA